MEAIMPIFHRMANDVKKGAYSGDFIRAFAAPRRNNSQFMLYIGISHNHLYVSCGTIDKKDNISIKSFCSLSDLKFFSPNDLENIGYQVYKMANIDPVKMPDILGGKLNEVWRKLTSHFRSLEKEERKRLGSPIPMEDIIGPVNYLFDENVAHKVEAARQQALDEKLKAAQTMLERTHQQKKRHSSHPNKTKKKIKYGPAYVCGFFICVGG